MEKEVSVPVPPYQRKTSPKKPLTVAISTAEGVRGDTAAPVLVDSSTTGAVSMDDDNRDNTAAAVPVDSAAVGAVAVDSAAAAAVVAVDSAAAGAVAVNSAAVAAGVVGVRPFKRRQKPTGIPPSPALQLHVIDTIQHPDHLGDSSDKLLGRITVEDRLSHYKRVNAVLIAQLTETEGKYQQLLRVVKDSMGSKWNFKITVTKKENCMIWRLTKIVKSIR
jgi:negative regulator of sigma E activity